MNSTHIYTVRVFLYYIIESEERKNSYTCQLKIIYAFSDDSLYDIISQNSNDFNENLRVFNRDGANITDGAIGPITDKYLHYFYIVKGPNLSFKNVKEIAKKRAVTAISNIDEFEHSEKYLRFNSPIIYFLGDIIKGMRNSTQKKLNDYIYKKLV